MEEERHKLQDLSKHGDKGCQHLILKIQWEPEETEELDEQFQEKQSNVEAEKMKKAPAIGRAQQGNISMSSGI